MSGAVILSGSPLTRRVMFVLELVDPVTGALAGDAFDTSAQGLRRPAVTREGRLVWLDVDPPADRSITVRATARGGRFAAFEETLAIGMRAPGVPVPLVRRTVQPTGTYQPPAGRLAASGMVIEDEAGRAPVPGAEVVLVASPSMLGAELRSTLVAVTDARGGFVAVAAGFGSDAPRPAPHPAPDGMVTGWIEVTRQAVTRRTGDLRLYQSRLTELPSPLIWADLT